MKSDKEYSPNQLLYHIELSKMYSIESSLRNCIHLRTFAIIAGVLIISVILGLSLGKYETMSSIPFLTVTLPILVGIFLIVYALLFIGQDIKMIECQLERVREQLSDHHKNT